MALKPTVSLIGFLDTKVAEHVLVRETLKKAGCDVIMIDISIKEASQWAYCQHLLLSHM